MLERNFSYGYGFILAGYRNVKSPTYPDLVSVGGQQGVYVSNHRRYCAVPFHHLSYYIVDYLTFTYTN